MIHKYIHSTCLTMGVPDGYVCHVAHVFDNELNGPNSNHNHDNETPEYTLFQVFSMIL